MVPRLRSFVDNLIFDSFGSAFFSTGVSIMILTKICNDCTKKNELETDIKRTATGNISKKKIRATTPM